MIPCAGRTHAPFVTIHPISSVAEALWFGFDDTPAGVCGVVASDLGIHALAFLESPDVSRWVKVEPSLCRVTSARRDDVNAARILHRVMRPTTWRNEDSFRLVLTGTDLQLAVWNALLRVPAGQTLSYGDLARQIRGSSRYARAVGGAVAANPVAFLIPCHRVVPASGDVGRYRWGTALKIRLLEQEGALPMVRDGTGQR